MSFYSHATASIFLATWFCSCSVTESDVPRGTEISVEGNDITNELPSSPLADAGGGVSCDPQVSECGSLSEGVSTDSEVTAAALRDRCNDGASNGGESDVDCGGACPLRCATGRSCQVDADCFSGRCVEESCARPTCDDGRVNQDESDVDCGGECSACGARATCRVDTDCEAAAACSAGICLVSSCQDGIINGSESFLDCGGSDCPPCDQGQTCTEDSDCSSSLCGVNGVCLEPTCEDATQNGSETGIDCGGECPSRCETLSGCLTASDCLSAVCSAIECSGGLELCCQPSSCTDGVTNGAESAVDCGGPDSGCPSCGVGQPCDSGFECSSGLCNDLCQPTPPCEDQVVSGDETDTDCGGPDLSCARCQVGRQCLADADCQPGLTCSAVDRRCVSCADGVQNGDETGIDCGGSCGACSAGESCRENTDCLSNACELGICCGTSGSECIRCAERFASTAAQCRDLLNPLDQDNCSNLLTCLNDNPLVCTNLAAIGCADSEQAACNLNQFGGPGGLGVTGAQAVLTAAACAL